MRKYEKRRKEGGEEIEVCKEEDRWIQIEGAKEERLRMYEYSKTTGRTSLRAAEEIRGARRDG